MLKRPRVAYYFANDQDKADLSQQIKAVARGQIPGDFRPLACMEFGCWSLLLDFCIILRRYDMSVSTWISITLWF